MHPGGTRYFLCVLRAGVSARPNGEWSPPFSNEGCALPPQEKCTRLRGCGPIDGSVSLTAAAASASAAAALENKKSRPRPAATQPAHRTEQGAEPPSGDPPSLLGLKEGSEIPLPYAVVRTDRRRYGLPVKRRWWRAEAGGRAVGGGWGEKTAEQQEGEGEAENREPKRYHHHHRHRHCCYYYRS